MLTRNDSLLIFVDVQGKLSGLVDNAEGLFANLKRLLQGMNALDVPVLVTEQLPEKLGPTREEFREFINFPIVAKSSFGCGGDAGFMKALEETGRKQIILCGIETHVCIYQTAMQLLADGFDVSVVADAVTSRDPANKDLALRRLEREGVRLTGTEMLFFELLGDAKAPGFKSILKIVK